MASNGKDMVFVGDYCVPAVASLLMAGPSEGVAASRQLPTMIAVDMALAALQLVAGESNQESSVLTEVSLTHLPAIKLSNSPGALLECHLNCTSGALDVSCCGIACLAATPVTIADHGTALHALSPDSMPRQLSMLTSACDDVPDSAVAAVFVASECAPVATTIALLASSTMRLVASAESADFMPTLAAAASIALCLAPTASALQRFLHISAAVDRAAPQRNTAATCGVVTAASTAHFTPLVAATHLTYVQQPKRTASPLPALQAVWAPCASVPEAAAALAAAAPPQNVTWALLTYAEPFAIEDICTATPSALADAKCVNIVMLPAGTPASTSTTVGTTQYVSSVEEASQALKSLRPHHTLAVQLPEQQNLPGGTKIAI